MYGSLAEEEVKTESDVIEGMEIATRSKGMKSITFWNYYNCVLCDTHGTPVDQSFALCSV